MTTLTPLRIALDWTPNTLHAPLLLAKSLNYYKSAGLDVSFIIPSPDYPADDTPARKLQNGTADLALCPSETVLSYVTSRTPLKLEAISALLKKDASRIAAIPALGSPAELRGFRYGSYNARFEDDIVRAVVRNSAANTTTLGGGDEDHDMDVLFMKDVNKFDMLSAMMQGQIEATWIFEPWEGVRARMAQFPCQMWEVGKFGVKYSYSPVIVRDRDRSPDDTTLKAFLAATKKGVDFLLNKKNEKRCVEIMKIYCPADEDTEDFLKESLEAVRAYVFDGKMDEAIWENYLNWLQDEKLVQDGNLQSKTLFTNEFHAS